MTSEVTVGRANWPALLIWPCHRAPSSDTCASPTTTGCLRPYVVQRNETLHSSGGTPSIGVNVPTAWQLEPTNWPRQRSRQPLGLPPVDHRRRKDRRPLTVRVPGGIPVCARRLTTTRSGDEALASPWSMSSDCPPRRWRSSSVLPPVYLRWQASPLSSNSFPLHQACLFLASEVHSEARKCVAVQQLSGRVPSFITTRLIKHCRGFSRSYVIDCTPSSASIHARVSGFDSHRVRTSLHQRLSPIRRSRQIGGAIGNKCAPTTLHTRPLSL